MGDVSIIARRISEKEVEYGWSGNGGYFKSLGYSLLKWYNTPEEVSYVFSLGQYSIARMLYTYKGDDFPVKRPMDRLHYRGITERELFSKILFVDYGYFYDGDNEWYYIIRGPFRIKIPLWLVSRNITEDGYEFDFRNRIPRVIVYYIFHDRYQEDQEFRNYLLENNMDEVKFMSIESELGEFPLRDLFERYKVIYDYFDDWIVIKPTEIEEDRCRINVIMKKKSETHIETLYWDE